MTASAQDHNDVCRSAAQGALSLIPLSSVVLRPLLTVTAKHAKHTDGASKPPALRRRRLSAGKEIVHAENDGDVIDGDGFRTCLATLEVLQWKAHHVPDVDQLVAPLQSVLEDVLPTTVINYLRNSDTVDDAEASIVSQAARAYLMQLALAVLHGVAQRQNANAVNVFDIDIAIRCAQLAPDSTVRSVALAFVGTLADVDPPAVLKHVLDIVAVIKDASSSGELLDSHSTSAAASTLEAVATAWVRGGGDAKQLIAAIVEAVATAPAQRRLPLVRALAAALPEGSGTWMVVEGLLERGVVRRTSEEMEVDLATALVLQVSLFSFKEHICAFSVGCVSCLKLPARDDEIDPICTSG